MTSAQQLMEEELQQSVLVSEDDGELDDELPNGDTGMGNDEAAYTPNAHIDVSTLTDGDDDDNMDGEEDEDEEDDEDDEEEDDEAGDNSAADLGEDQVELDEDEDDDEEGEEEDDDQFEDDAEGEDEDEIPARLSSARSELLIEDGNEVEDDDEGVGAVKIKPGDTDDEEESDESASSHSESSSEESEGAAAWEDTAGQEEGEEEEDDEESETGSPNICMFCKQDEDNDPSEEFEAFLVCSGCGENSHQQCARDANAIPDRQSIESWTCPECAEEGRGVEPTNSSAPGGPAEAESPPAQRRATAQKLARDLLPSQKGTIKPDSHSVFNQLVLDEDPMDGSRVLRKRKTSSAEADEIVMSLRKRRKNSPDESGDGRASTTEATRPHSARSLRLKVPSIGTASVTKKSKTSLLVGFKVDSSELRRILSRRPKGDKKRSNRSGTRPTRPESSRITAGERPLIATPFTTAGFSQPFYSFYDKDRDELKGKPYGGILDEAEADTSKTYPSHEDRKRFDEAKKKADEEWKQRLLAMQAEVEVPIKKPKKSSGPASQIECIEFGGWEIDTWYAAPYPEEYSRNRVLYICEFCLKYMNSDYVAWRHKLKCPAKHPPGDEIYRHGSVSVFEVDGRKNPVYCQNLCLLAKLFLGSKTLYYDVEPFLFYVLCEYDDLGYHFVGYFSKEKRASSQNNVSCILTLPIHQRKGYGNLLIDFSYLLTRVEEKTGSPEKPLSDMGLVSYRNYWRLIMCRYLLDRVSEDKSRKTGISIKQISDDTGLTPDDVISALEGLRCLVRDPQTQLYAFRVDLAFCQEYIAKWESKNYVKLNPKALTWTPYVMGRSNATNFELGPALNAIAPREDEEESKPTVVVAENLPNGSTPAAEVATNGDLETAKTEPDSVILESTEPNDTDRKSEGPAAEEDPAPNGLPGSGASDVPAEESGSVAAGPSPQHDWTRAYESIPPGRFQVFPPISGAKRVDRSRPTVGRPPVARIPSSAVRPRPKRSTGGSRRSTTSKPKSSSKRKTGGTGRGPGRWPKGTKKSDYGNADSGPGLPPAWIAERNRLAALAATAKSKKDVADQTRDTVQVQTVKVKESKNQKPSEVVAALVAKVEKRNGASTESSASRGRRSPRSRSSRDSSNDDSDVSMEDADGEEEDE